MIPKKIHYCWFGEGPMPKLAIKCIKSWKKNLPEYELVLWNENSFDIKSNSYVKEAYDKKKYAFVTDYVRLFALYAYGGVYMDTDVEVLKSLNDFLKLPAFSGFENDTMIPTGIMASEKGGKWVEYLLSFYNERHFILPNGKYDTTNNVKIICDMMKDGCFIFNNTYQNYKNIVHMFPKDYFCPKSYETGEITITKNTYTIHHFAGSWLPNYIIFERRFWMFFGSRDKEYLARIVRKLKRLK